MYIFPKLKTEREAHNKSQRDISAVLNVKQNQYWLYETGKRELPLHHAITLAKLYGITLDELVEGMICTETPEKATQEPKEN